jgi:hypothetical protein
MPFEDAEIADEGEAETEEQGDHTKVLTLNSALSISFFARILCFCAVHDSSKVIIS